MITAPSMIHISNWLVFVEPTTWIRGDFPNMGVSCLKFEHKIILFNKTEAKVSSLSKCTNWQFSSVAFQFLHFKTYCNFYSFQLLLNSSLAKPTLVPMARCLVNFPLFQIHHLLLLVTISFGISHFSDRMLTRAPSGMINSNYLPISIQGSVAYDIFSYTMF